MITEPSDDESAPLSRYTILGVKCDAITISGLLRLFEDVIDADRPNVVIGNHNIHSIYLFQRDRMMRQFYDLSFVTYLDSMPLVFFGKLLGLPLKRENRTAFLDWHPGFLEMAEARGWRIYYLGGRQETVDKASAFLKEKYPNLSIQFHNGFFDNSELPGIYDEIRAYQPHVVLVGMGMPRQEKWIVEACKNVRANLFVNGGAMIEYMVGEQPATPRWLSQLGLEWCFRLVTQPRRLGQRYLVEPFFLLKLVAEDLKAAWNGPGLQREERYFDLPEKARTATAGAASAAK